MKRLIALIALVLLPCFAQAQLTPAQIQTLATGLRASQVPEVQAAVAGRNDSFLGQWCNTSSATNAWNEKVSASILVDASPLTLYDGLTAGKRGELELLLTYNPLVDMRVQAKRDTIVDSWGTASRSVPILQAGLRKATNCELLFGSTPATTNTVTGEILNFVGNIPVSDISTALNEF